MCNFVHAKIHCIDDFFFFNSNFKNAIILVDIFTPFHLLSPLIVRITCLPGNCSSLFPRPDKQTKHVSQAVKVSRVGFKKQNLSTHLKNSFAGLLACSPQSHEQKKNRASAAMQTLFPCCVSIFALRWRKCRFRG